jgi:hypothetical protein
MADGQEKLDFRAGDLISIAEPLGFCPDAYRDCRKVRQWKEWDGTEPDIPAGSGGVVLGHLFSNTVDLFVVWIDNERCILWDNLIQLVQRFEDRDASV